MSTDKFQQEAQSTLDIPYQLKLTRSTIGLIADNGNLQIMWEKDLLTGEIQFYMKEDEKIYIGKGLSCREAFAKKQEYYN